MIQWAAEEAAPTMTGVEELLMEFAALLTAHSLECVSVQNNTLAPTANTKERLSLPHFCSAFSLEDGHSHRFHIISSVSGELIVSTCYGWEQVLESWFSESSIAVPLVPSELERLPSKRKPAIVPRSSLESWVFASAALPLDQPFGGWSIGSSSSETNSPTTMVMPCGTTCNYINFLDNLDSFNLNFNLKNQSSKMEPHLIARDLPQSPTIAVFTLASQMVRNGVDVINFGVGEMVPEIQPPREFTEGIIKAIQDVRISYSDPQVKWSFIKRINQLRESSNSEKSCVEISKPTLILNTLPTQYNSPSIELIHQGHLSCGTKRCSLQALFGPTPCQVETKQNHHIRPSFRSIYQCSRAHHWRARHHSSNRWKILSEVWCAGENTRGETWRNRDHYCLLSQQPIGCCISRPCHEKTRWHHRKISRNW